MSEGEGDGDGDGDGEGGGDGEGDEYLDTLIYFGLIGWPLRASSSIIASSLWPQC